jgi:protoporphyrinogen oxidase
MLETIKQEIADISFPVDIYTKSLIDGKLYDYPVSIENVLSLPRAVAVEVIDELHKTDKSNLNKARTFEDYVTALVGKTLFSIFFRHYTEKLWGLPVAGIPKSWAPQRISFRKDDKRFFPDEWCVYFYRGIEDLVRHMRETADAREVTSARIRRIERAYRWRIFTEGGSEEFDGIISTIPISQTLEYLGSRDMSPLFYRSFIVMYQEIMRREATPADWIYFPEGRYIFTRIFELNRFAPLRQVGDKSSITIEIPCAFGDEVWLASDRDLAAVIQEQVVATGLYTRNELGDWEFIRRRYVYPMHDLQSSTLIKRNLAALKEYPGIFPAGRLGLFRYMNMDETILSSKVMAEEGHQVWSRTR